MSKRGYYSERCKNPEDHNLINTRNANPTILSLKISTSIKNVTGVYPKLF
jgi:hypothetical protein